MTVSVNEARKILGKTARKMEDEEVIELIALLEALASEALQRRGTIEANSKRM